VAPSPEEESEPEKVEPSAPIYSTESSAPPIPPASVIQRAAEDDGDEEEIDLTDLARRIYPVIRRMLSIERERTLGRGV
jgi:hypothetical protein